VYDLIAHLQVRRLHEKAERTLPLVNEATDVRLNITYKLYLPVFQNARGSQGKLKFSTGPH
jgi:hypothetical protein